MVRIEVDCTVPSKLGYCAVPAFVLVVVKPPYEVTETGWGEFEIIIKIYFNDPNERPVSYIAKCYRFHHLIVCLHLLIIL